MESLGVARSGLVKQYCASSTPRKLIIIPRSRSKQEIQASPRRAHVFSWLPPLPRVLRCQNVKEEAKRSDANRRCQGDIAGVRRLADCALPCASEIGRTRKLKPPELAFVSLIFGAQAHAQGSNALIAERQEGNRADTKYIFGCRQTRVGRRWIVRPTCKEA